MKILYLLALGFLLGATSLHAQKMPLSYYLPEIAYDTKIPTPEAYFGFQIGEWHISHDQQYAYMRKLAELSPRVKLVEHGRTYENRPLIHLLITSEKNHQNLESIRTQHVALTNPDESGKLKPESMPAVIYQGFSIHGNEASGANAAPLVAYYLVAGQSPEVEKLLNDVVIVFDPSFNPDGLTRFSTWANYHKNQNLTGDSQDREYAEAWPGGRFNHYWFDLNRDWLLGAHPESRGRAKVFHDWKPNILTDHHEMGTNSSFFFMPGVPTRVNPITPKRNQELTAKIGTYHAKFLDEIGSLYYTQEGYDDFYYGKGSTFPDANGCIGILFEQASSRGHLQETVNGPLAFHFTVRNQVRTALSTQKAAVEMRQELLEHQRGFFKDAQQEAKADPRKGFVFGDRYDLARVDQLVEILRRHQIEVYSLKNQVSVDGKTFDPGSAFLVPLEQAQYKLIRGIFETATVFEDSIFYDISSWTLPLSFNLPYAALGKNWNPGLLGAKVEGARPGRTASPPSAASYAYLMEWDHYYAPKALYHILKSGIRAKVGREPFVLNGKRYEPGTVMIPMANQEKTAAEIQQIVRDAAQRSGVAFDGVSTGFTLEGIDLGSNGFTTLQTPKVAVIVGEGASPGTAGEAWHLLDTRYGMVVTKLETDDISRADLTRYNVLVLGAGSYNNSIGATGAAKLKDWVQNGGTLIGIQSAISWLKAQGIGAVEIRQPKEQPQGRKPYIQMDEDIASLEIPGTIFEAEIDNTHPLGFGYRRGKMPVFRDNDLFLEPGKNPYSTPLIYTDNPLISGYIKSTMTELPKRTAGIVVSGAGSGKVIFMADNPNFRAHWFGTNKLFANAVFFGQTISGMSLERSR